MTEPHHALTVDGEGEDSGGNEVHEIYVRLGAAPATALNEKDTLPCQNESKDTSCFVLTSDYSVLSKKKKDTLSCLSHKRVCLYRITGSKTLRSARVQYRLCDCVMMCDCVGHNL
jgi:hypothetical protein